MTRPNAYAMIGAIVVGFMGAIASGWLWLEGHGRPLGLPVLIVKPLWFFVVIAVPGPILVTALFREHFVSLCLVVGLILNVFLYWLLFRAIIWILMFGRRLVSDRASTEESKS